MKNVLLFTAALLCCLTCNASLNGSQTTDPTLVQPADSTETQMEVPSGFQALSPQQLNRPNLKRLIFNDLTYVGAHSFNGCENLEEVIFKGTVFHCDGYVFQSCPKLRRIVFQGPLFSSGGPVLAIGCPELREIEFGNLVFFAGLTLTDNCPKFEGFKLTGKVLDSNNADILPVSQAAPSDSTSLRKMARSALGVLDGPQNNEVDEFLAKLAYHYLPALSENLRKASLAAAADSIDEYLQNYKAPLSKLDILKQSEPYERNGQTKPEFVYMHRSDSTLKATRKYFNLDSIAGRGDDISRIKNLTYWLHDLIRHDGSSSWPKCRYNAPALYEVCQKEDRGLNCRFLAMMLTECLLAEGIPARYLTCQSKDYDTDSDCHVICMAWSRSLGKWVWADPSFAAFVYDENGTMLHPGEVRERLQKGLPLEINDDANWNHINSITKEEYLDDYMAKNLYIIECNIVNKGEAEGRYASGKRETVCLVPAGFRYNGPTTTDDKYFWQSPKAPERIRKEKR